MRNNQLKWLYAKLYFAWVGLVHYVEKFWPFVRREPGLLSFGKNYFQEGFKPCSKELRAIANEPGRCTTCGLCDLACPENLSPMRMLLASSVSQGGFDLDCSGCTLCEQACPENIPIITYVQLASKTFYTGPSWCQIDRPGKQPRSIPSSL